MDNNSLLSLADETQGSELEMGLNITSPLMLSPTNEASNPFFTLNTGDYSQALILDLGMNNHLGSKHRLTPQDVSLSLDYFDNDYFSMAASIKRQRVNQHPTRSSSSSLASSASSATPSEADSDLLERGLNEDDTNFFKFDQFSDYPFGNKESTLTDSIGLGFHLGYNQESDGNLNHSKSTLANIKVEKNQEETTRQQQQQQHAPNSFVQSQASVALNTFNLSDFISDQEQEQQQQQHHQFHQVGMEARANAFMTPERPMAHRDVSRLMMRSNSYSPASSLSSQSPGMDYCQMKSSPLNAAAAATTTSATGELVESHGLFTNRSIHNNQYLERSGLPMRSFSGNIETLSCNPAHITPSHERRSSDHASAESNASSNGYFFSSPSVGHSEVAQKLFGRDISCSSPMSQFSSSPSQSQYNLFNSGDEQRGDVFEEASPSPNLFQDGRPPMMHSFSVPHSRLQQEQETQGGAMRSSRSSTAFGASPYQSPALDQGHNFNQAGRQMKMEVPGIITKRSRGRRVPNNPEELNNLGKSGKVYTCKVPGCGKCFKRSEHLKRHVRSIHTDEKPYTCHCGKTFSRHDNLNQHARVHEAGGVESPSSLDASLSPTGSPMSLPSAFAATHIDSKHSSFNAVNSRLRQTISTEEECEGDESQDQSEEAEMFALES